MTEFKRTYFGTVLGYLWSLIRPLMLFGVLLFVFTKVFKIGSEQVEHYPVMLLLGIVLFTFFQEATHERGHLGRRPGGRGPQDPVPAPGDPARRPCSPAPSTSASTWSSSSSSSSPSASTPTWTWLLFPFAVLALLFVFTAAVSMALSVLYVRFRDVAIIWTVVAQVLFYATPILYPIDRLRKRDTTNTC